MIIFPDQSVTQLAQEVLTKWDGRYLPIDPIKIGKSLGLDVQCIDVGSDHYNHEMKIIRLNKNQDPKRLRFCAAFLLGCHKLNIGSVSVSEETFSSHNPIHHHRAAIQFALEMLMPEKEFKRVIMDQVEGACLENFADIFGVGTASISVRLRQTDLVRNSGPSFRM